MNLVLASSGLGALPGVLPAAATELRLGFVTAAADPFPDPWWVARDRTALVALGFYVVDISLRASAESLDEFDVLFVAGGNTFYLLQQIRASGFDAVLTEFLSDRKLYVGSSAGAIIAGPDISITAEPEQRGAAPHLESTVSLGLVPFHVLPHAGVADERFARHHSKVITNYPDAPVVRITNNEALRVTDDGVQLLWSPPFD